jgi:hypothetical protein
MECSGAKASVATAVEQSRRNLRRVLISQNRCTTFNPSVGNNSDAKHSRRGLFAVNIFVANARKFPFVPGIVLVSK